MQASKLSTEPRHRIFNRRDRIAEGWYWLLLSNQLRKAQTKPAHIAGHELVVYRGEDGSARALDAYCPHMGAHLAEGKVEGNDVRCFFHNWCFDGEGTCVDIPCMQSGTAQAPALHLQRQKAKIQKWHLSEKHGVIWIWLGNGRPDRRVPEPPELTCKDFVYSVGNRFTKNCHPNVVMINAIDEQHFRTVHKLPGEILSMEPIPLSPTHIAFHNRGKAPNRLLRWFYRNTLTYNLDYWNGSTGTVTLGPDFLHLYLMFALRLRADGATEGIAIAFAPHRAGILGATFNQFAMLATKIAGLYFAVGDTKIFQTIKFDLKTPIAADRAVIAFIQHLERQEGFDVGGS